jgi:hypothetical protein
MRKHMQVCGRPSTTFLADRWADRTIINLEAKAVLKMEAVCSSETLVSTYKSILRTTQKMNIDSFTAYEPQISIQTRFTTKIPIKV